MSQQEKPESLIRMLNQITANNTHYETDELAATAVANHLKKFWARSMKQQILAYAQNDGEALLPVSKRALEKLTQMDESKRAVGQSG